MTKSIIRRIVVALTLILAASSCGSADPIDVQIVVEPDAQGLDDLTRLDYRVFVVEDLDEVVASATNPNGSPVQAVSCEILATAAPDATDCTETARRVTRDRELLDTGAVPADGLIQVEGGQRIRVYASLRADQLRMDAAGRVCSWNGNQVIETDVVSAEVEVRAFC